MWGFRGCSPGAGRRTDDAAHRFGCGSPGRRCFSSRVPGRVSTWFLRYLRGGPWSENSPTLPGRSLCTSRDPTSARCCNVATYCLTDSRRKTLNYSGRITAVLGITIREYWGVRQNWYNGAFYGAGFCFGRDGVGERGRYDGGWSVLIIHARRAGQCVDFSRIFRDVSGIC